MAGGVVRLIHGDIDSGKTRRAAAWAEAETLAGRSVGGVLALKTPTGRRFLDLVTGEEVALEAPRAGEVVLAVGRFQFRQAAFDWAVQRVDAALEQGAGAIVIDEVGPLEMRGGGFSDLLDRMARDCPSVDRVLLVRTGLIDDVVVRFGGGACLFDPPRNLAVPAA